MKRPRLMTLPVMLLVLFLAGCEPAAVESPARVAYTPGTTRTVTALAPVVTSESLNASPTSTPDAASMAAPDPTRIIPATDQVTSETGLDVPKETVTAEPTAKPTAVASDLAGALIAVSLQSQVGVLLDEFPGEIRQRVAEALLSQSDQIWSERAARQVRLTRLRLNFRQFNYAQTKGQLPLPPAEQWQIKLDPAGPRRQTIQGHEFVTLSYTFATTVLTDQNSPAVAEPALAAIGGVWEEPFVFPIDPDLILQRTGNSCINEGGFPPHSFDSENAWHFYDYDCTAESGGALGCHRSLLPELSCRQALQARVGEMETRMRFERLPWDTELADSVRSGIVTQPDAPDLMVVAEDLANNRITYRYIAVDDCALEEGAVGDSGWRRLLQFDATVHNVGGRALHIGPVVAEDLVNHVFDYNLCHDHFHYTNYGEFYLQNLDQLTGSKQAFCVQSTDRLSNNEYSPLVHEYTCRFQGIQAGWVDEYIAGLDAQWIDITTLETEPDGRTVQLGFASNGDRFLCEGRPQLGDDGQPLWEASGFMTEAGEPINRPRCEFIPEWDNNNVATWELFVPATGGMVTAPCLHEEAGPLRDCGFAALEIPEVDPICRPGQPIELSLAVENDGDPQVLRVCEWSEALGVGVACTFEDAVANTVLGNDAGRVAFTCPAIRDAAGDEPSGRYSLYAAPVWPADGPAELDNVP